MVRHNHDANVPPEQQQQPLPDSDDFDFEEGVGSTEGNSQTNDDNTTTTRKFNALEKRLDLLEEDVMDLQMNNDKMVLAYAAAVPFVLTFTMYCLRHFASSMSRDWNNREITERERKASRAGHSSVFRGGAEYAVLL